MITTTYLKKVLPELKEFEDADKFVNQFKEGDGYDEIVAILGNIRSIEFPCIVLEDRSSGTIGNLLAGPLDRTSIALWIMDQGDRDETEGGSTIFKRTFSLALDIIKLFIRDKNVEPELAGWDIDHLAYNKRMGGPKCFGYELVLTFEENIDLSTDE